MNIDYYKIYHNYLLAAILLGIFIEGYGRPVSGKTIFTVLPILFSNDLSAALYRANKSSTFYTVIGDNFDLNIYFETKYSAELTKMAILYGINMGYFNYDYNKFISNKEIKVKTKILKKLRKSAYNLGIIFSKFRDDDELFYHLTKY